MNCWQLRDTLYLFNELIERASASISSRLTTLQSFGVWLGLGMVSVFITAFRRMSLPTDEFPVYLNTTLFKQNI